MNVGLSGKVMTQSRMNLYSYLDIYDTNMFKNILLIYRERTRQKYKKLSSTEIDGLIYKTNIH